MIIKEVWPPQPNNNPTYLRSMGTPVDASALYSNCISLGEVGGDYISVHFETKTILRSTYTVPGSSGSNNGHEYGDNPTYTTTRWFALMDHGVVANAGAVVSYNTDGHRAPTSGTNISGSFPYTYTTYYGTLRTYAYAQSSYGGTFTLWRGGNTTTGLSASNNNATNNDYPTSFAFLTDNTGAVTTSNYPQGRTEFGQDDSQASFNPSSTLLSYSYATTVPGPYADVVRITGTVTSGSIYSGKKCALVKWLDDTNLLVGYYDGTNVSFDVWNSSGTRIGTNVFSFAATSGYNFNGCSIAIISPSRIVICEKSTGVLYLVSRSGTSYSVLSYTGVNDTRVEVQKIPVYLKDNRIMLFAPVQINYGTAPGRTRAEAVYIRFDATGDVLTQEDVNISKYVYPKNAVFITTNNTDYLVSVCMYYTGAFYNGSSVTYNPLSTDPSSIAAMSTWHYRTTASSAYWGQGYYTSSRKFFI